MKAVQTGIYQTNILLQFVFVDKQTKGYYNKLIFKNTLVYSIIHFYATTLMCMTYTYIYK